MDVARAEADLDALAERRARQADVGDLWAASVKRDRERRRRALRAAWYAYHVDQAERLRRTMTALVERHEAEALKLIEEQPKGASK